MAKIFFKNSAKQYDTWNGLTFSFSENDNGRLEFKIDNPNQQIILEMDKSEFESEVRQVNKAIQVQAPVSDDFGELNTASQTFSLDSMINQILWDAQIDDDYLDEARESIKILIEKANQNSR